MSITNFINSEASTIVRGVNGIRLCRESWMTEKTRKGAERCEPASQPGEQAIEQDEAEKKT